MLTGWTATSHGCGRQLDGFAVSLRPHLKTAKSIEVARRVMTSPVGPATVSTLKEAEQFAAAGVRDIIYAVGIAPSKLARVHGTVEGVDLAVVLDTVEQAEAVAAASREDGNERIPALIEIDCDGHRSGVPPDRRALASSKLVAPLSGWRGTARSAHPCRRQLQRAWRRCASGVRRGRASQRRLLQLTSCVRLDCPVRW